MDPVLLEWLGALARWTHVIAAIMWIGDSFLFVWMDTSLEPPTRLREGNVAGEMWMVHSGGFYEVVKRRSLAPDEMPPRLHWFKWEAYTTWISGFLLLGIVYYFGGGVFLVDHATSHLPTWGAIATSVALLAGAWLVYDWLWRSPLGRRPRIATAICLLLVVAACFGLPHVFTGRAAFLHLGAMFGTIMAANVWRVIIPGQHRMLEATRAGRPVDLSHGVRAKMRSMHNHYLTLPVVFVMLSNHLPSAYGSPLNGLVLLLLVVLGFAAKHVMRTGARGRVPTLAAGIVVLAAVVMIATRPTGGAAAPDFSSAPRVSFAEVEAILQRRCLTCHSAHPTNPSFPQPPAGVTLDVPAHVHDLAPRIMTRAVVTKTMPLGNLTGMTEEERRTLGAWIAQGAHVDAGAGAARETP